MGPLADDAARLLTALRIPRALVSGLSMGGMVAQEIALRHPACPGPDPRRDHPGRRVRAKLGPEVLSIARGGIAERGIRAPLLFSSEFRPSIPSASRS